MTTIEPFGTTPLPVSSAGSPVRVLFDASSALSNAQQPQSQQIAAFEATPSDHDGSLLAVNPHFVVYAVKNGLIRVLHRHSTMRALLRSHKNMQVTDVQFFQDGDIVATAAHNKADNTSNVIIWRIYERSPDIVSDILLEIRTQHCTITRVVWHPFNVNQFWMIHTTTTTSQQQQQTVATLVESTRITTHPHETETHSVCHMNEDAIIMDGAVQLASRDDDGDANLTDVCWSNRETRHVLTSFDNGEIILWDMKQLTSNSNNINSRTVSPQSLCVVEDDVPMSSCRFLPHENAVSKNTANEIMWTPCFATGSDKNRLITLWSAFGPNATPTKLQVVGLEHPSSSYLLDVCFGPAPADASPPSCFLVLADQTKGELFAWHCRSEWNEEGVGKTKKALLVGCDYVVPFQTRFPTFSWCVEVVPTTDISEEDLSEQGSLVFDMKIFGYQPTMVQALTLTSYMCLPPENSWTEPTSGVRVERLTETQSAHVSEIESVEGDMQYDETYDLEDDEDIGSDASADDDFETPDSSVLPTPQGFNEPEKAQTLVKNPFANWLGALAGGKTSAPTPPTPPVALPKPPAAAAPSAAAVEPPPPPVPAFMLSPTDILKNTAQPEPIQPAGSKSREITPTTSNSKGRKKSASPSQQKKKEALQPQILKRKDEPVQSKSTALANESSRSDVLLPDDIRQAIREEIQASVVPQLRAMLDETLKSTVAGAVQSSMRQMRAETDVVTASSQVNIDASVKACFAESMRSIMIPTMESVANQILGRVSEHLDKASTQNHDSNQELEAISKQLTTMTSLVVKLTGEVQALKKNVAKQQQQVSSPASTNAGPMSASVENIKRDVLVLLQAKNYMGAFTKAVSATTAEIALFCCSNADIDAVLGGNSPELSPTILLCLMQQLGTCLALPSASGANLQLALQWLQELTLSLSPSDADIAGHVPTVLQQLVAGINARMAQNDPDLRRPLQRLLQAIRGMQIG